MATASLFGAAHFAPQSAMEILKTTKRLPTVPTAGAAALGALAWGIGSANWQPVATPTDAASPAVSMKKELRALVAASHDVFMRLQRLHAEKARAGRELVPEEVVRASREYREALKTSIFALEDRTAASDDDDELLDLLKVSLAIWHLCELLFLQRRARDDKQLAYDIALWLQEHYGSAKMDELDSETQRLRSLGGGAQSCELDTAFWPTVYGLVAMGCGPQAWSVLSHHSLHRSMFAQDSKTTEAARESFQMIQRLLLCMPGGQSRQQIEWQNWRDACQYLINTVSFVQGQGDLKKLLEVMTADTQTLRDLSGTWYELMMARLFLEEPKPVAHRFEFLMANCFQDFHEELTKDTMNNFDCIVLAILEYNVQSAVQDIHSLGFHWMSAHLTDLLAKSSVIAGEEVVEQYGCALQEYFLLQYAMEVGVCSGTWQFTTSYFGKCPAYGATASRAAVAQESLKSDAKADRLFSFCSGKKGMQQSQRLVSLRRSLECKQDRRFGAALQWALRSNHADETDTIGELVLDECETSGSLTPLFEAVEFLESQPELARTKKLQWLIKYRELHLVLEDRIALKLQMKEGYPAGTDEHEHIKTQLHFVSKEAAARINHLISSSIAPRRLRSALLTHIESLLRDSPTVLSSEQLFQVMAYLQSIDRGFDRHDFHKNPTNLKLKKRVQALLSNNVSEAMLAEEGKGSFATSQSASRPQHDHASHSFASLTGNLQLLAEKPSNGLLEFAEDESME